MAEHERRVARYSTLFLRRIDPSLAPWGVLLGRWHDLGKYQEAFQERLQSTRPKPVEHSGVGAAFAWQQSRQIGPALAFAIAGHHTGLANLKSNDSEEFPLVARHPLRKRIEQAGAQLDDLLPALPESVRVTPAIALPHWLANAGPGDPAMRCYAFFTRMIFSVLVDADRLATAEFYATQSRNVYERATKPSCGGIDKRTHPVVVYAGQHPENRVRCGESASDGGVSTWNTK